MTIVYLLTFVGVLVFVTLVCAMALVPTALDLGAAAELSERQRSRAS